MPRAYPQYLTANTTDDRNHKALVSSIRRLGGSLGQGSVLDVGCGSGKLVRFLRTRGVEAYGVEPAEALFDRFLADDPAFVRNLDTASDTIGQSCAVVIAVDVPEHEPTLARAAAAAGLRVGAVERPGRLRSAGHLCRYVLEFGLHRRSPGYLAHLDSRFVAINLRDTILVSRKVVAPTPAQRRDPVPPP